MLIETLLIGFFALIAGLIAGVFLSQGLASVTAKLFSVDMKKYQFVFDIFFSFKHFIKIIVKIINIGIAIKGT